MLGNNLTLTNFSKSEFDRNFKVPWYAADYAGATFFYDEYYGVGC